MALGPLLIIHSFRQRLAPMALVALQMLLSRRANGIMIISFPISVYIYYHSKLGINKLGTSLLSKFQSLFFAPFTAQNELQRTIFANMMKYLSLPICVTPNGRHQCSFQVERFWFPQSNQRLLFSAVMRLDDTEDCEGWEWPFLLGGDKVNFQLPERNVERDRVEVLNMDFLSLLGRTLV